MRVVPYILSPLIVFGFFFGRIGFEVAVVFHLSMVFLELVSMEGNDE